MKNGDKIMADYKLTERMAKRLISSAYNTAKLSAFEDIQNSTDDRIICFYNYDKELEALMETVNRRPVSIVNGKIKDLNAYDQKSNSITFIQYQAGAMGLNLQKANKIVYFSLPDGDCENFDQSTKRIHRIGQDRPCFYYLLLAKDTIDEEILENVEKKQKRRNYL